jgi:hypothetical protein
MSLEVTVYQIPCYNLNALSELQFTNMSNWWPGLRGKQNGCVGFEIITLVFMTNIIFWVVTPCSVLEIHRCFGESF